ncbi:MAG TPA: wax ester/triacylglycerol synthase domain-containing protein [Pseudonocardiaceae bacterium]|jgi:WS/DGAT/MGAT family acyltransferase|nr:wax ester/triacylglycerol synthase domain-containing protein [Pseudonocardiaceae bacterium]
MAAERDRLSRLDTAFLCLERDITPMQLGALAIFQPTRPVPPEQVAALLAQRARQLPQLGRRVQRAWFPPGAARWVGVPEFRPEGHIHLHHLDGPGGGGPGGGGPDGAGPDGARPDGVGQVAELAAELMARPLPRDRPLWEFHVMSGLGEGRFAVLVKLHHALSDGLAAREIGVGLLDGSGLVGPGRAAAAIPAGSTAQGSSESGRSRARRALSQPLRLASGVRVAAGGALGQAAEVMGVATAVLRSARLPSPGSPLVIMSSGRRGLGLARLELEQVRRIRTRFGGTVNDVLLAVLAGALREWLGARGHPVDGLSLRALIPVSRRARAGDRTGGNQMSGYLCELPVAEPDPGRRLRAIQQAMGHRKAAGPTRGPGAIPLLADRLPCAVHRVAAPVAGQVAALLFDILVTSVPMPRVPLRLDGAELAAVFPIAPLAPGHALGVALSCYRGTAYIGLHADRAALPDVQGLAEVIPASAAMFDQGGG